MHIKLSKPIAFPTETVYGLGAPIFDEALIAEIFRLKGRPLDNPLIAHIGDLAQLNEIVLDPPEAFYRLAAHFFPGPLSIVLQKAPAVPDLVTAGLKTLAVRMPRSEAARALIRKVGVPLVAPSANLSGKPSSTTAAHVRADFGQSVDVIEGVCDIGVESTVIVLEPEPMILRPGAITKQELEAVLGCPFLEAVEGERPMSPGMKYRHYAPEAEVHLFTDRQLFERAVSSTTTHHFVATMKNLYAELRATDACGFQQVCILYDPNNQALENRLKKASASL